MTNLEQQITNIYLNSWIYMKQYAQACMKDIWFNISDIKELIWLMKSWNIGIQCIELFKKPDFQFEWSDFWYKWSSLVENYELVDKFLFPLLGENIHYLNIWIFDSPFQIELDGLIQKKYWGRDSLNTLTWKSFN